MAGKIRKKGQSSFIGSTIVGIKQKDKNVYSKRQGKNVNVVENTGSVQLSNGNFLTLKISKSSDEKYKATGVAYWVECAEFSSGGGR